MSLLSMESWVSLEIFKTFQATLSVADRRSLQLAVRIGSQITMATDWCVCIHFKFRQLKDLRGSEVRIWEYRKQESERIKQQESEGI